MDRKILVQELADALAKKKGITKKESELFVRSVFEIVEEFLVEDKIVKIKELGTFKLIVVDSRESVNVNTGERIRIASHAKVTFSPDKNLADQVNRPFSDFETVILNPGTSVEEMERIDLPVEPLADIPQEPAEEDKEVTVAPSPAEEQPIVEVAPVVVPEPVEEPHYEKSEASAKFLEMLAEISADEPRDEVEPVVQDDMPEQQLEEQEPDTDTEPVSEEPEIEPEPVSEEPVSEEPEIEPEPVSEEPEIEPEPVLEDEPIEVDSVSEEPEIEPEPTEEVNEESDSAVVEETVVKPITGYSRESDPVSSYYPQHSDEDDGHEDGVRISWGGVAAFALLAILLMMGSFYMGFSLQPSDDSLGLDSVPAAVDPTPVPVEPVVEKTDTLDTIEAQRDTLAAPVPMEEKVQPTQPDAAKLAKDYEQVEGGEYWIVGTKATHEMAVGDNLYKIAKATYGDKSLARYIIKYNGIENPDVVHLGAVLKLPELVKKE